MLVRRAAVAGTWYPSAPAQLSQVVERYVRAAAEQADATLPAAAASVALIAPHAGLVYSGHVAAHAYRLLSSRRFDTIVLVGPSHFVAFEGAAVWPRGAFQTPLGDLRVDDEAAADIASRTRLLHERPGAHLREHSLEMQLPFLAALAPDTPVVPIVMGEQTRGTAFELGDAIATALQSRRVLLVASSDLSHYHDARTAARLDAEVMARVDAFDAEGLMDLLEERPGHACGGGPMVSVLRAAQARGATSARVLRYADSGDVSGDKSSVVGYMAAVAWL